MNTVIPLFLLMSLATGSITAQTWTSQFGIEGGVHRQKPAGTGGRDEVDRWELPNSGAVLPNVFVLRPLRGRIALESGVAVSHTKFEASGAFIPASSTTEARLMLRANVLVGAGAYIAAGGMIRYREIDDGHSTQTGMVGAVGYQRNLGSKLSGRIEARWLSQRKTDSIAPSNVYALLVGVSRQVGKPAPRANQRAHRFTPWRVQLGTAGGYVRTHLYGSFVGLYIDATETVVRLPGAGSTTPPPLYFVVPLRGRFALELGIGAQRTKQGPAGAAFDGHLGVRANVALFGGAYAGAGPNVRYVEQSGMDGFAFTGATVAVGYRLPLIETLEGRVDLSYTAFKERANFPFAQNDVAALLGIAVALH